MISIICPVTDEKIYQSMLLKSIYRQTYKNYEIIKLNSKKLGFNCASDTLNYGVEKAKGDILVFVHQDVEFLSNSILNDIDRYSKEYDFAIAGVCGVAGNGKYEVSSSVTIGLNHRQAGKKLIEPQESYVLDECLFFIKRDKFLPFENIGNTWHFYAVDYCLRAQIAGEKVYIFPLDIYHLSPGWSLNYDYFNKLLTIGRKYKSLPYISTCMGVFKNNCTLPFYCEYRKFKLWLKKVLHYERKE